MILLPTAKTKGPKKRAPRIAPSGSATMTAIIVQKETPPHDTPTWMAKPRGPMPNRNFETACEKAMNWRGLNHVQSTTHVPVVKSRLPHSHSIKPFRIFLGSRQADCSQNSSLLTDCRGSRCEQNRVRFQSILAAADY